MLSQISQFPFLRFERSNRNARVRTGTLKDFSGSCSRASHSKHKGCMVMRYSSTRCANSCT
eukprot:9502213-Pyramimonas_sp.AAC.3